MADVIGLGNAIIDITAFVSGALSQIGFQNIYRGGFFRTTQEEFESIKKCLQNERLGCGGSVANSLKAMAVLGISTGFVGKVGSDIEGLRFKEYLGIYNVENSSWQLL